jgi:hypothetical protein
VVSIACIPKFKALKIFVVHRHSAPLTNFTARYVMPKVVLYNKRINWMRLSFDLVLFVAHI